MQLPIFTLLVLSAKAVEGTNVSEKMISGFQTVS